MCLNEKRLIPYEKYVSSNHIPFSLLIIQKIFFDNQFNAGNDWKNL